MTALPATVFDVGLFGMAPVLGHLHQHAVVDLRRTVSPAELGRALAATIDDFPVLGCRYETRPLRDRWVPLEEPPPLVVEETADVEAATRRWVLAELNPCRDRPIRLVLLPTEGGCRLVLTLLHIAVDGGGTLAVAQSLAAHLNGHAPDTPVERRRDVLQAFERVRWWSLPLLVAPLLGEVLLPLRLRVLPPRTHPLDVHPAAPPTWTTIRLSAEQTATLKAAAKDGGATMNDALLFALCRVGATYSESGPLWAAFTIDVRRYLARPRRIAANLSAISFVRLPRSRLDDGLSVVAAETKRQSRRLLGLSYIGAVALALGPLPHALARRVARLLARTSFRLPMQRALAVTNLGRLDEGLAGFGDDLAALRLVGPCVRDAPIPIVVATGLRGGLQLDVYAPAGIGEDGLKTFGGRLTAELSRIADPPEEERP